MQKVVIIGVAIVVIGVLLWAFGLGRVKPVTVIPLPVVAQSSTEKSVAPPVSETLSSEESVETQSIVDAPKSESSTTSPPIESSALPPKASTPEKTPTAGSTRKGSDTSIAKAHWVNFGFSVGTANRSIDTMVIHSTYNAIGGDEFDVNQVVEEYHQAGVSPHYVVARDGTVYQLVHEKDIAWHAGVSKMPKDDRTNINDFSIGIEMIGTKTSGYTDAQYSALKKLIADIKSRHSIKHVVGHNDIAPGRKTDPWAFDWKRI
jgi:hypothetical protein